LHACVGMAVHRSALGGREPYVGRPGRPADSARALARPQPASRKQGVRTSRAQDRRAQIRPSVYSQAASYRRSSPWLGIGPKGPNDTAANAPSGIAPPIGARSSCMAGGPRIDGAHGVRRDHFACASHGPPCRRSALHHRRRIARVGRRTDSCRAILTRHLRAGGDQRNDGEFHLPGVVDARLRGHDVGENARPKAIGPR